MRLMQECEVIDEVQRAKEESQLRQYEVISNLVVRCNQENTWRVEFLKNERTPCTIRTRRGEVKEYSKLETIVTFMKKVGVKEFKIALE